MPSAKALKNKVAARVKRFIGEVIGDQKLDEEGRTQEQDARNESEDSRKKRDESGATRPFGNLDRLT